MPTIQHGVLQLSLITIIAPLLTNDVKIVPPITFRGLEQKYTPDASIYFSAVLAAFFRLEEIAPPPLIAIEIISPGQTIAQMVKKCEGMIASGVEECWIVEPANESITVCTKERRFVRHEGETLMNRFLREPLSVDAIFRAEIQ